MQFNPCPCILLWGRGTYKLTWSWGCCLITCKVHNINWVRGAELYWGKNLDIFNPKNSFFSTGRKLGQKYFVGSLWLLIRCPEDIWHLKFVCFALVHICVANFLFLHFCCNSVWYLYQIILTYFFCLEYILPPIVTTQEASTLSLNCIFFQ